MDENLLKKYRCCLCDNILSVPPIMLTNLQKETYKCGRCKNVKCQTFARVTLFENFVSHMSFPCSYAGCTEKIPWNRVEQHETSCRFRTFRCPMYQNCCRAISKENVVDHFRDKHPDFIKKPGEICEVSTYSNHAFLLVEGGQYFFLYILYYKGNIYISVLAAEHNDSSSKFNMKVLPFNECDPTIFFDNVAIVDYDEKSHCFACISRKCNQLHHPFSEKNQPGYFTLDKFTTMIKKEIINSMKSSVGNIRLSITLGEDPAKIKNEDRDENPCPINIETLNMELTCPCCMLLMAGPIYMCARGHNICKTCRPQLKHCPLCIGPFSISRNFALEHISKDMGIEDTSDADNSRTGKMCIIL